MKKVLLSIFASIAIVFSPITIAKMNCDIEIKKISARKEGQAYILVNNDPDEGGYYNVWGQNQVELVKIAYILNMKICMDADNNRDILDIRLEKK